MCISPWRSQNLLSKNKISVHCGKKHAYISYLTEYSMTVSGHSNQPPLLTVHLSNDMSKFLIMFMF